MLENPWLSTELDEKPFAYEKDLSFVEEHNASVTPDFSYELGLRPEPYIGNLNAKIMLLALNPGVAQDDFSAHEDPAYIRYHKANLQQTNHEMPFYYLDNNLDCSGKNWWLSKLRWLISECGLSRVSASLCCLQYIPYHSKRYKNGNRILPSQFFIRDVFKSHMDKGGLVVCLRSKAHWQKLVPELVSYGNVITLRNPRNPALSPNNMGQEKFWEIVAVINESC